MYSSDEDEGDQIDDETQLLIFSQDLGTLQPNGAFVKTERTNRKCAAF